ncbi:hemolysin XhlA family protein [Yoonia vestfoldensis]|uniref:Hemolysin XhlA n=1 Tax=Yoonia vestfoldensis TaxID=245188 RepID=A0A1Y0EB30_9RHOB|nr:hemolysin XhlA family protein [Yoonia vestfoldensis]ARU00562.1 hemolysin XhlA [Yoonia vestfoldensis]
MESSVLDRLESRLRQLETRNAVDAVHRDNVANRLGAIEDTLKWLVRLIIGAMLMAAVSYAVPGGLML